MQKLFENWRKYVNESNEPDHLSDEAELAVHPEADVGQPEKGDDEKLLDVFWGSGAQAMQLAEMTGNTEMVQNFNEIIQMIKGYVSMLDGYISDEISMEALGNDRSERISNYVEDYANEIVKRTMSRWAHYDPGFDPYELERSRITNWIDMVIEAGDYIWYHGPPLRMLRLNIASEKSSKSDYEELKRWAGI